MNFTISLPLTPENLDKVKQLIGENKQHLGRIPENTGATPPMGNNAPPQIGGAVPPQMGGAVPPQMGGAVPPPQMGNNAPPPPMGNNAPPPPMGNNAPPPMGNVVPPPPMGNSASPPPMGNAVPPPMGGAVPPPQNGNPPPSNCKTYAELEQMAYTLLNSGKSDALQVLFAKYGCSKLPDIQGKPELIPDFSAELVALHG